MFFKIFDSFYRTEWTATETSAQWLMKSNFLDSENNMNEIQECDTDST